jgi:hypothetical protein
MCAKNIKEAAAAAAATWAVEACSNGCCGMRLPRLPGLMPAVAAALEELEVTQEEGPNS